jgi:hypothetical protein
LRLAWVLALALRTANQTLESNAINFLLMHEGLAGNMARSANGDAYDGEEFM